MALYEEFNKTFEALVHDLRREIYRKQLLPGNKISSEQHLARKYRISRGSVRKALDLLAEEGLIYWVKGSGTFVAKQEQQKRLHAFTPETRKRQILFLSFSTAFSEETLYQPSTFVPLFDGLSRVLNAYRYNLLVSHVDTSWTPPACLLNHDVAGIVFHGRVQRDFWEKHMKDLPCVGLNHFDPDLECSWVKIDNMTRSYLAVKHLWELGHRKIAFAVHGMEMESANEERMFGFKNAMRHFDLPCPDEYCIVTPYSRENGERRPMDTIPDFSEELKIFKTPDAPTALILGSSWAVPFTETLKKFGLNIPGDVSFIDGINKLLKSPESPTCISDRLDDICAEGARNIIEIIENGNNTDHKTILIKPELYIGKTTAVCKK